MINGLGRHEYYLTHSQRRNFKIIGWVDWMQTFITLMLTKTSICLFLLRIVDSRKIKIAIYALIGCLITFTTICVCLFLGVCRPLKAYWDVGVDGVCLSDHQLESVVLAQGSKIKSPPTTCVVANAVSPFHHFGSYMCGLSGLVPAESSDQNADKGCFVCLDGPRCDV